MGLGYLYPKLPCRRNSPQKPGHREKIVNDRSHGEFAFQPGQALFAKVSISSGHQFRRRFVPEAVGFLNVSLEGGLWYYLFRQSECGVWLTGGD